MSTPDHGMADEQPPEIAVPGRDGFLACTSGRSLYCVTHAPPGGVAPRGTAVLFQAFAEERKASHRSAVRLASALARAGVLTHRLDLPGCGESTGRLAELVWQDWLTDAAQAAGNLLGAAAGRPRFLGGIRLGATVAGLCRPAGDSVADPLQWLAVAPILRGAQFLHNLRTRRAIRQDLTGAAAQGGTAQPAPMPPGSEEFDGFLLNAALLQALEAVELPRDLARTTGVVVQAGPATAVTKEFQPLADLPGRPFRVSAVRQEPVWERGEGVNDSALIAAVRQAITGT